MNIKSIVVILFILMHLTAFAQKKNTKTEIFKVYGNCTLCKNRIEKALHIPGVYKASWSVETKMLTLSYDSLQLSKSVISKKLAAVGHDTEEFQSDENTYNSLPECCFYERYKKPFNTLSVTDSTRKSDINQPQTNLIAGIIFEEDKKGKLLPLANATVRCLTTNHSTTTDSLGVFRLVCSIPVKVAISYVGFKTDTLALSSPDAVKIILRNASNSNLNEVVVSARRPSTYISSLNNFNTLNISSKELTKAACCNLSESFETSPSVDVSYADAVTGMKQIQLLGLSGNYTQITTENTPEIRGLAGSYGLTFIPGPWIESIQVTKGTGSVANGYESIAGQINIEEQKPDNMDKLFINAYANNLGRLETSVNLSEKLNDKWSTAILSHANGVIGKTDDNKDGFMDIPTGRQFNLINRWRYADTKGLFAQFALKILNDQRQAGETGFDPQTDKFTTLKYGVGIDVAQYAFNGKLGYVFPQQKYKSIGFIVAANAYNNQSYYGLTPYNGKQRSIYANLIYQSIIATTAHKFRTGLSFVNDNYKENYNTENFNRTETVPGAFFEYTYTANIPLTVVAGFRLDKHNEYGWMATPRLNLKYDFTATTNLRFSVGKGFRTANIFAENTGLFASSKKYSILNPSINYGYGLKPEKAWNYGFNFVQHFNLNNHNGSFSLDAYRTNFTNQVVVDIDTDPSKILFYNLSGKSYSNSLQGELNYEVIKKLDVRLAYRWLDVQTDYSGQLLQKALIAKHRAFINLAYETDNHWKFDYTTQWFSKKRLPHATGTNNLQAFNYSPSFIQIAAQVTKSFGTKWDVYAGAENLSNYSQKNLIISAENPFSPNFDGSIIWGPVNGRIIYTGMRFKIK